MQTSRRSGPWAVRLSVAGLLLFTTMPASATDWYLGAKSWSSKVDAVRTTCPMPTASAGSWDYIKHTLRAQVHFNPTYWLELGYQTGPWGGSPRYYWRYVLPTGDSSSLTIWNATAGDHTFNISWQGGPSGSPAYYLWIDCGAGCWSGWSPNVDPTALNGFLHSDAGGITHPGSGFTSAGLVQFRDFGHATWPGAWYWQFPWPAQTYPNKSLPDGSTLHGLLLPGNSNFDRVQIWDD